MGMATTRKKLDLNQLAKSIVDQATGETPKPPKKDGRSAGGRSRSESQTPDQRIDLARLAATARWKKTS